MVGLVATIVDARGKMLEFAQRPRPADEAAGDTRARIERVKRHAVAKLQGEPPGQQRRRDRAIDTRDTADGFRHLPTGIDREDDLAVAFGPVFLGIEFPVPRGLFPVDRASIDTRPELDECVEIGAIPAIALRQQALHRVTLKHLRALSTHRLDIWKDR